MNSISNQLKFKSWAELENVNSDIDLLSIAESIGKIIPHPNGQLIYRLNPKSGENSIKGTFSNVYGYNEFPLHTDTAFWIKPARFILLSSTRQSNCNTKVISATTLLNQLDTTSLKLAERAIFKVQTIHGQFYTSFLFKEDDTLGIRYDPTCMKPANASAKHLTNTINNLAPANSEVKWTGNKVLILDNWKSLHGRNEVITNEIRELTRIYIS